MTIGVGFRCKDGIVLCADNQITWPQNHKYYECKIYPHSDTGWAVAFTFAGNPNLMKAFDGKFQSAMMLIPPPYTAAKIQELIETVLSLMDVLDNDPDGLHMLCGIAIPPSDMKLLKTERKVVTEIQRYDYVGVGDSSLLRYLGPLLAESSDYISRQALILGTYFVLKAKTYVEGCGGDTDAIIVRPNGHLESKINGETYRIEQQMLRLEKQVRIVASSFFDKRVLDEDLAQSLDRLAGMLKEDHFQMGIGIDWKDRRS